MQKLLKLVLLTAAGWTLLVSSTASAQCTEGRDGCPQRVPRVMKFNGSLRDANGTPRSGMVGILFAIYGDSNGGAALWQETQNVQLDHQGHYEVMLGAASAEGVPLDLFRSGEPRWLGAQAVLPGESEQPRVLLVSVPYALVSGDAATLGGLPPSAFVQLAPNPSGVQTPGGVAAPSSPVKSSAAGPVAAADTAVTTAGGTVGTIPKFSTSSGLVDSPIKEVNGEVTVQNLGNIFFADQFTDGVPGAIAACPPEGCIIYAGSKNVNRNLGTINPGNKLVTIYLGPYTYTVKSVVLRNGLKLIGMSSSIPGTILQSVNGNEPIFIIPQTPHVAATSVRLSGLRIIGSVGNTSEDAFFIDASNVIETGLWYSAFDDLYIYNFAGVAIHLKGPTSNFGAANQWLTFSNVVIARTSGGANGIRIEGANFQLHFTDCQVDGQGTGDGTNIFIGNLGGNGFAFPFDITFRGLVSQAAAVAVQLDGAQTVTFQTSHHELLWGAYLITNNSGIGTHGVTITDSVFNPNVGSNNGAGYLLRVATPSAFGIYFTRNRLGGAFSTGLSAPDSIVNADNGAQVVYQDNQYYGALATPPTSGITPMIDAAATVNIGGAHTIAVNSSTTPISTIQSTLGPGETVTFLTVNGPVTFAGGGNIAILGSSTLTITGTITMVRSDVPTSSSRWWPVSQWTATSTGGTSGSFQISGDSSATVTAGEGATYNLTLTSTGGLSGLVQLACSGTPPDSSCSVTPSPATLSSGTSATSSVVVTTKQRVQTADGSHSGRNYNSAALCLIGALVILPASIGAGKRSKNHILTVVVLMAITSFGCGGTSYRPPPVPVGTPKGKYIITVKGTVANISRSVPLTLTVL